MIYIETSKPFKKVGTHHGKFHADEVMATAILKQIYNLEVIRTRNNEMLKECDIVYDVGGGEYDHHDVQKVYRESGTPYAACGLIWRSFGKEAILFKSPELTQEEVNSIFRYTDSVLIEGIDAADNGLKSCDDVIVTTMSISTIISGFNPPWHSDIPEEHAFHEAVNYAAKVLLNAMNQKLSVIKARGVVMEAYKHRNKPEVMVLDIFCPWGQTLRDIDKREEVQFVIHPNKEGFVLHTVREHGDSYAVRKNLPKSWAGKRDVELSRIIGIDDAVFCHPARFIAGAKSLDSTLKMADVAVAEPTGKKFNSLFTVIKRLLFSK